MQPLTPCVKPYNQRINQLVVFLLRRKLDRLNLVKMARRFHAKLLLGRKRLWRALMQHFDVPPLLWHNRNTFVKQL